MALRKEDLEAKIHSNSPEIRRKIMRDLNNPKLQSARTPQEWVALGGSPFSWEDFAEQHPEISLHGEGRGDNITDISEAREKKHGHEASSHAAHYGHAHGTSIGSGRGIMEDDPRYAHHVNELRNEYLKKRSDAIESLKDRIPPPTPPMEKPKMLDATYNDKNKSASVQYWERVRQYEADQKRYKQELAIYQNKLDSELAKKGVDQNTTLNRFYGAKYANQSVKTIDDEARENYLKELEETARNNPNTLKGKKAADKLSQYANAEKQASVFAANDFHIQLTQQQIERNFQQRRNAAFEAARRVNPNLTWEKFLKDQAPLLKELRENVTKAGWTNAKDRFGKFKLSQYQYFIEREIIKNSDLSKDEKNAKLRALKQTRPALRTRIGDVRRRFVAIHVQQRGERIAARVRNVGAFLRDPRSTLRMHRNNIAMSMNQSWQDTVKSWQQRWKTTKKVYNYVRHPIKSIQNLNPKKWLDNLNPMNRVRTWANRIRNIGKFLKDPLGFLKGGLQNYINKWRNRIQNAIKLAKNIAKLAKNIFNAAKNILNFLKNAGQLLSKLPALLNALMGGIQALGNLLSSAISGLVGTVIPAITAAISAAISAIIGLIGAAIGALAGIAGGIFLLILLLIVGVIIIIILLLFGIPNYEPSVHLTCGSSDHGYIVNDFGSDTNNIKLETLMNEFYKQYHIHLAAIVSNQGTSANAQTTASASDMVAIYDTICQLFGHQEGSTLPQYQYNTFGTDVVGNQDQISRVQTQEIFITVFPPLPQYTDCSVQQTSLSGNLVKWTFYGTENCVTGTLSDAQATPKLQYLVARTLGYSLVYQENYMKSKGTAYPNNNFDVLNGFKTPLAEDGLLPTTKCTKDTAPQNGTVTTGTATDCLAEGVASYFTYAAYSDFTATFSATGNKFSDLATQLVLSIQGSCKNPVDKTKIACTGNQPNPNVKDCLTALSPNPGAAVEQNLRLSTCSNTALQCVGFAQAVAIGVGAPIGDGNAGDFNGNPPVNKKIPGYTWHDNWNAGYTAFANDTIQIGDIPIWSGSGCQHIAVVVTDPVTHKVPGQNNFTCAEANGFAGIYGPAGTVIFDHYTRDDAFCRLEGWWRKQ